MNAHKSGLVPDTNTSCHIMVMGSVQNNPTSSAPIKCQGLGSAIVIVTTYTSCLKATLETPGYPETVATYSLVSGFHNAAYSLGNFIGPSIAGIMYQKVQITDKVAGIMYQMSKGTNYKVQ